MTFVLQLFHPPLFDGMCVKPSPDLQFFQQVNLGAKVEKTEFFEPLETLGFARTRQMVRQSVRKLFGSATNVANRQVSGVEQSVNAERPHDSPVPSLTFFQEVAGNVRDQIREGFPLIRRRVLQLFLHAFRQRDIDALFPERFSAHWLSVNHTQENNRLGLTRQYSLCMIRTYKMSTYTPSNLIEAVRYFSDLRGGASLGGNCAKWTAADSWDFSRRITWDADRCRKI
jgi:hypothetical protein